MFSLLVKLHGLLFRGCLWLLMVPLRALWAAGMLVLAWLGEEFRRWAGLAVSGVMLVLAGRAVLNYAPPQVRQPLALTVLVLLGIWALAVARAARYTRFLIRSNLQPVRTRQTFRRLFGKQAELGEQVKGYRADVAKGIARRTRGTPAGGVFRSNREAARQEAADRAEAERQARAAEVAKAKRDRELERLGAEHDPFVKQGG